VESVDAIAPGLRVPASLWVAAPESLGQLSPALLAAMLVAVVLVTAGLIVRGMRRTRIAETWGCGRIVQTPRMEYTAAAFAEPLRRVFAELYRPTADLSVSTDPESKYFVRSITYTTEVRPWFETVLFDPLIRVVRLSSARVRRLQGGSAHLYLLYVVVALLGALASVWWF
jgi:hypothetical protein